MIGREGASDAAGALAAATALVVTGVTVAVHAYQEHELKLLKDAIAEIEQLYKLHLERIIVPGYKDGKTVKLPPIFDEGTSTVPKPKTILQIEILEDLYKSAPVYSDPHLRDYGHHILNAMRKMAEFYDRRINDRDWFHKGSKEDVTSAVLCYLILMLSEHCIKFEGYNVDIAYLEGISNFVNAFASLDSGGHEERFEQLTEAHAELLKAKDILIDHSTSLSMEEMITEFESNCGNSSERMVRLFTKLIMPNDKWKAVDFASMDHLSLGMVKPRYEYKNGGGIFGKSITNNAVLLPDCIFGTWLKQSSRNYIDSLLVSKEQEMPISSLKFTLPEFKSPAGQVELKKLRALFASSSNFLSQTVVDKKPNSATKQFVPVTDDAEVSQRAAVYFDFYQLIDRMIVAQYYCSHIWRQIKQLGEKYVSYSQDCDFIFQVLDGLGTQIDEISGKLIKELEAIELATRGAMQKSQENLLVGEFRELLKVAKEEISPAIKDILEKHNLRRRAAAANNIVQIDKEDVLLKLSAEIRDAYGIKTVHQVTRPDDPKGAVPKDRDKPKLSPAEDAKAVRKVNPRVAALYTAINEMRTYGESLLLVDVSKGQVAIDLANQLEDKADEAAACIAENKPLTDRIKYDFHQLLHSKDTEMSMHRALWKPIVANIGIAFTGIGLFFLLGKLIQSKIATGYATLFFMQTNREKQVEMIEERMDKVRIASAAPAA